MPWVETAEAVIASAAFEPRESKKSLMPEGFEKQIDKADLADLLELLTHKGKRLPIPLDKVAPW